MIDWKWLVEKIKAEAKKIGPSAKSIISMITLCEDIDDKYEGKEKPPKPKPKPKRKRTACKRWDELNVGEVFLSPLGYPLMKVEREEGKPLIESGTNPSFMKEKTGATVNLSNGVICLFDPDELKSQRFKILEFKAPKE